MLKSIMAKKDKGGKETTNKKGCPWEGDEDVQWEDFCILKFPAALKYTMYVSLSQNNARHSTLLQRRGLIINFTAQTSRILL